MALVGYEGAPLSTVGVRNGQVVGFVVGGSVEGEEVVEVEVGKGEGEVVKVKVDACGVRRRGSSSREATW
jgi:hypothetical protein